MIKILITLCLLLTFMLSTGCQPQSQSAIEPSTTQQTPASTTESTTRPIEVHLSMSESPFLDKPVKLIATFEIRKSCKRDAIPNIVAKVELPKSFQLVNGIPQWRGDLNKGAIVRIELMVKSTEAGRTTITADALAYLPNGEAVGFWNGYNEFYTYITQNEAIASDSLADMPKGSGQGIDVPPPTEKPPPRPPGEGTAMPPPPTSKIP